ncbi:MAG: PEP-CTERM sorting domain-containing protein [Armatimonadetes bacterium]|nr:PEP-CTERM sorting domain-containing protein [Armatimonadota bacterium]
MKTKYLVSLCVLATLASPSYAAILAADDASHVTYDDGIQNTDNGGFGFQPWILGASQGGGHFVGTSGNNGGGTTSPNIDTAGRSWGSWALLSHVSTLQRDFDFDPALAYKTSMMLDNGWITAGSIAGRVELTNEDSVGLIFRGGQTNYEFLSIENGVHNYFDSGIGFTDTGMAFSVTKLSDGVFQLDTTRLSDSASASHVVTTDSFANMAQIVLANISAGPGSTNDAFINSVQVESVPEPATMVLMTAGLGALAARRRKK